MPSLHILNSFFEKELESKSFLPLPHWMNLHKKILSLQTLPLLYAEADDQILVTKLPPNPDPRLTLLGEPILGKKIVHWGPSLSISNWAKKEKISYPTLDWPLIQKINAKSFSYENSPKLPGSELLYTIADVKKWIELTPGKKVIKTIYGSAGNGHFHVDETFPLKFLEKEFSQGFPVIGEPWMERVLDFSTQWKEGKYLGTTICENSSKGTYRASIAGDLPFLFGKRLKMLDEHREIAFPLIEKMKALGFVDHVGIDAFIYLDNGKEKVHPIVEINARKTMGWIALEIHKKNSSKKIIKLTMDKNLNPQVI